MSQKTDGLIADSQLQKQEQELENFIKSHPDLRELKIAMAASLTLQGYAYRSIADVLKVSFGFTSKCKICFLGSPDFVVENRAFPGKRALGSWHWKCSYYQGFSHSRNFLYHPKIRRA